MKSMKYVLTIVVSMLFGAILGAYLSHPPQVKAAVGVRVQKVTDGYNMVIGQQVLGFACTQQDCYIATQ